MGSIYPSNNTQDFILKWTPRLVVAGFAGYYSLGLAYEYGIMAAVDRLAISLFKHFVGTAGIGAAMPSFQWYASWGVRITAIAGAEILYDLGEKAINYLYDKIRPAPKLATCVQYG